MAKKVVVPGSVFVDSEKQFDPEAIWTEDLIPAGASGDGWKLVKRETVNFTKDLAKQLLELTNFQPDRPLRNRQVARLLAYMRRGTFHWEQLQLMICTCDRKIYRLNGQHTCWARISFDDAPRNLPVQLFRYHAVDFNVMRKMYAGIDGAQPRTKSDKIAAYLFGSDFYPGASRSVIRCLSEGFGYWLWGAKSQGATKHDGDEIAYLLSHEFHSIGVKVAAYIDTCRAAYVKHLRRRPVFAAMFETFSRAEKDAFNFWEGVKTGANLTIDDPRLKLRNHLMSHSVDSGRGARDFGGYTKSVTTDDMYGWAIQAWNYWRKGKSISRFLSADPAVTVKNRIKAI